MNPPRPHHYPATERALRNAYHFQKMTSFVFLALAALNLATLITLFTTDKDVHPAAIPVCAAIMLSLLAAAVWSRRQVKHTAHLHSTHFPSLSLR